MLDQHFPSKNDHSSWLLQNATLVTMQRYSRFVLLGSALATTCACGVDSSTSEALDTDALEWQSSEVLPPEEWVDHKGRTWVRQGPAQFSESAEPTGDSEGPRMIEMTVDEIAMRIRPVTSFWGYVYMVEAPNYAEAERIKAGEEFPEISFPQHFAHGFDGPEDPQEPQSEGGPPDLPPASVIGSDQRVRISSNTIGPYSAFGLMTRSQWLTVPPATQGISCSNSLIGASTAVSAAHCYVGASPQTFTINNAWAYGVDRYDANPYPFFIATGCFFVFFNSGAWNAGAANVDVEDDYAVVEFSDLYPGGCDFYPGNASGYLGWGTASDSTIESGVSYVGGYPKWTSARSYDWPSIWWHGTTGSDAQSDRVVHYVDTTAGQSGGPLYRWTGSGWMVVGVHSHSNPSYNTARRIDGTFFNWICSYGDMGC